MPAYGCVHDWLRVNILKAVFARAVMCELVKSKRMRPNRIIKYLKCKNRLKLFLRPTYELR